MPRRIREGYADPVLMDTHVWIWLADGVRNRLSSACVTLLRNAHADARLYISPISVWEVARLVRRHRVVLTQDVREWVSRAFTEGIRVAPLTPDTALDSGLLPAEPPKDPADQMLIATARELGATLVTRDSEILQYGRAGHMKVFNAAA
jgi:PIN domain nuclease of toxin-antitoxin system